MKKLYLVCVVLVVLLAGCKNREREKQLVAREAALNQKEQQLLLREKTIEFREQELNDRARVNDSLTSADTSLHQSAKEADSAQVNRSLVGNWTVKMTCIETSCSGSAIGDTKVEQWNFTYAGNHLVAKASVNGKLVRTYSGIYEPNTLELIEHRDSTMTYDTRMVVRLQPVNETNMNGQREIIRENDCKIVYSLTLDKMKS